jgi:YidC/Oxa1 family membrane protein insertase
MSTTQQIAGAIPVVGSALAQTFQPIFHAMAWILAACFALVPNYALAIALLTIVVMALSAPLTMRSTRSMFAMRRLAPQVKKLQAKYKDDKEKLNEEMVGLFRKHGVNPTAGCLPMLIQLPIFLVLYDVIRGLTYTVKGGHFFFEPSGMAVRCIRRTCSSPLYVSHGTRLYTSLIVHGGKMPAFGLDLAGKLLGQHTLVAALPYAVLILIALLVQYLQMRQVNDRNRQMGLANPQAMMQRFTPVLFAVIYINVAAALNVYFIVSGLFRIGIQQRVLASGAPSDKPSLGSSPIGGGP